MHRSDGRHFGVFASANLGPFTTSIEHVGSYAVVSSWSLGRVPPTSTTADAIACRDVVGLRDDARWRESAGRQGHFQKHVAASSALRLIGWQTVEVGATRESTKTRRLPLITGSRIPSGNGLADSLDYNARLL